MAYERIQIVGNIGRIEKRTSRTNSEFISLRVAVDRIASKVKEVIWYEILLFGAMASDDTLNRYSIGREILVEGRPQVNLFQKRDGSYDINNVIIASSLPELLGSGRRA